MNGDGSGRRSRQARRVRMQRSKLVYRRRWEHDGSERQAVCHHRCFESQRSRCPAGISHLRSVRRSHFFECRAAPRGRSRAGSDEQLQRSRGSCGATLRPEVATWHIAQQRRSGMPSDLLAAQSRRSLRSTRHCEPMWSNDWQGSSSLRVELLFPARLWAGKAAGMDHESLGGGQVPGARSRLLAACRSTSRTMRRCASAMKRSIKRCSFKVVARCAAS
jgi:hypothetical protein